MVTPLLKISHGKTIKTFYNEQSFFKYIEQMNITKYTQKYYKGLGGFDNKESGEYFKQITKYQKRFLQCDDNQYIIEKLFKKENSD